MPWEMQRADIQIRRGIKSVTLAPGSLTIDVSFPSNATFLGATPFTVVFRVNGNVENRMYGTALVKVSQDLVITSRPLPRNHLLTASDLRTKRFNLTRLPRRALTSIEDVIGKRTKRPLQANAIIHAYEVEALPLIRKGDMVVIRVESPLLSITTMGLAVESGRHGETIRVKNLSSQREVRAVVVNAKTVQVPF